MAIVELTDEHIEQVCETCGTVRTIDLNAVIAGIKREDQINPMIVQMAPCANCGSKEFFIGSTQDEPEHPSPGSYGHRHRLLVDILRSRLVKSGKIVEGMDPDNDKGREPTPQEIDRWFKGKLRLKRKKETETSAEMTPPPAPGRYPAQPVD